MKEHVCREKACVFGNVYLFSMSLFQYLRLSPQNYWQHFLTLIPIYHPFLWFHLHTPSLCCHPPTYPFPLLSLFYRFLFCFFVVYCLFCVWKSTELYIYRHCWPSIMYIFFSFKSHSLTEVCTLNNNTNVFSTWIFVVCWIISLSLTDFKVHVHQRKNLIKINIRPFMYNFILSISTLRWLSSVDKYFKLNISKCLRQWKQVRWYM
jgi:hypothetical protein